VDPATPPTVWLVKTGASKVTATGVTVSSSTTLTGTLPLPSDATAVGQYDVVVQNADGQSATLPGGFNVVYPPPSVISVVPSSAYNGTTVAVTISGSNFNYGSNPTIWLTQPGAANIYGTDKDVIPNSEIKCSFVIPLSIPAGNWDIMVQNPDGGTADKVGAFTVLASPTNTLFWTWSNTDQAWTGWGHGILSCTDNAGTCVESGPSVLNGVGVEGSSVVVPDTADSSGSVSSHVYQAFTNSAGATYSTITLTGTIDRSSLSDSTPRILTIKVNGNAVYSDTPGDGTQFTITRSFAPSNRAIVEIITEQDWLPAPETESYTMQFNSLTLSS
jgi:hypothetical protein